MVRREIKTKRSTMDPSHYLQTDENKSSTFIISNSSNTSSIRQYSQKGVKGAHLDKYFPIHKRYVEPFSTGLNVLLNNRCSDETINDTSGNVTSLLSIKPSNKDTWQLFQDRIRDYGNFKTKEDILKHFYYDDEDRYTHPVMKAVRLYFLTSALTFKKEVDILDFLQSRLSVVEVTHKNPSEVIENASENDLLYVDIPEAVLSDTNALKSLSVELTCSNAQVAISGWGHQLTEEIFDPLVWERIPLRKDERKTEVLLVNYLLGKTPKEKLEFYVKLRGKKLTKCPVKDRMQVLFI